MLSPPEGTNTSTIESRICPVSGLPIVHHTEWEYFNPENNFRVWLSTMGHQILLTRASGAAIAQDILNSLRLTNRVIRQAFRSDRAFVQIGDYSAVKGMGLSFRARRNYIDTMKKRRQMVGLIFFGVSSSLKLSIKLGVRLNPTDIQVQIAGSYAEAVAAALNILSERPSPRGVSNFVGLARPPKIAQPDASVGFSHPPNVLRDPKWEIHLDGFDLVMEMINGNILHTVSSGYLRAEHIPAITILREKVCQDPRNIKGFDYLVVGVSETSGGDWKARQLYMAALKKMHSQRPFYMYVFYGANRFIRSAANLARPFTQFKIKVAQDFEHALRIVAHDQAIRALPQHRWRQAPLEFAPFNARTRQYVNDLLTYLGSINWADDDLVPAFKTDDSHPFREVFDALELIKSELNDLLKEREKAENDLREARDELEQRVLARTAELVTANRELAGEVKRRREMLAALEKSHHKLKQAQDQLIQSAKLASLGELVAGIAHELNQPLMVIRAIAQLLRSDSGSETNAEDDRPDQLQMIERNTRRMMTIIDHLRVFARQSNASHVPLNINEIIKDTFLIAGPLLYRKDIAVKQQLGEELPLVKGEANRLEQVFLNLITNAMDAMDKDGELVVISRLLPEEKPVKSGEQGTSSRLWVEILFRDTGTGVDEKHRHSLFDPFFTTKKVGQGTGLGLSIAYGIIKDHSGEIQLAETGSGGTTLRITLPAIEQDPKKPVEDNQG